MLRDIDSKGGNDMSITRSEFIRGALATTAGLLTLCGCGRKAGDGGTGAAEATDESPILIDTTDEEATIELDGTGTENGSGQDGFVVVQNYVPDVMTDVRYFGTYNFVGERIDGYEEPLVILCREAADALRIASDDAVSRGYRLKIFDGYRPQRAVDHFCRWAEDASDTKMKEYFYPELEKSTLFPSGYIAEKSRHTRGSTVDISLFDMGLGKDVDMGGTFDYFGVLSHPDTRDGLSDEQYENRMILREIMVGAGFEPLETEWWHFKLADEPYPEIYFDFPVAYGSLSHPMG